MPDVLEFLPANIRAAVVFAAMRRGGSARPRITAEIEDTGEEASLVVTTMAIYDGVCTRCGELIREGDRIYATRIVDPALFHADELHRRAVTRWTCESCRPRPVRVRRMK
jgi:hypothetical protein